jgi:hypothetical protein
MLVAIATSNNRPIDQDVVEQEEMSLLGTLATHLPQHAFSDEDTPRYQESRSSSELVLYVQDFVDVEVALSQSGLGLRKGVIR